MAARFAKAKTPLAAALREIQDLTRAHADAERRLLDLLAKGDAPKPRPAKADRRELDTSRRRQSSNDAWRSPSQTPDFAELTDPKPLSIAATQALLGPDEALVSYMVNADHTMVWAVTSERTAWLRSPIGRKELDDSILTLRLLLDTPEKKTPTARRHQAVLRPRTCQPPL